MVVAGMPLSIGTRELRASSPTTTHAIPIRSASPYRHAPTRRVTRSQPTGQYRLPSVTREISWIDRVGVSTTPSAANGPGASPVPGRPLYSTPPTTLGPSDELTALLRADVSRAL